MRKGYTHPLWFDIVVAATIAIVLRLFIQAHGGDDVTPGHGPAPQLAFFQFFLFIAGLIWKGVEVAGRVTLEALRWVVLNLSLVVTKIGNGLKVLGGDLLKALKRSWDFTRKLYDDVLKPAWSKFWKWFDQFRHWLDATFKPILDWLLEVRNNLLAFYKNYVRPWLDLIDVTRKLLRVLAALHIPFARELDRRLGKLEEQIEKPFRFVLSKINEVIGIVNRVITLDGLLQRLVLVRSLARDYEYAWRAITQPYSRPASQADRDAMNRALAAILIAAGAPIALAVGIIAAGVVPKAPATVEGDVRSYLRDRGGVHAPLLDEMTLIWRAALTRRA